MRVRMKLYVGRLLKGIPLVYVIQVDGDSRLLQHKADYNYVHAWGTRGTGSLQLAYDMLYDATSDAKQAQAMQYQFQRSHIVPLPSNQPWTMTEAAVLKAACGV